MKAVRDLGSKKIDIVEVVENSYVFDAFQKVYAKKGKK